MMLINKPYIVEELSDDDKSKTKIIFPVTFNGIKSELFYQLDTQYSELLTDTCDAALVGLLLPAMALGEDIHVDGVISEQLFHNLSIDYQFVAKTIIPHLNFIKIIPEQVSRYTQKSDNMVMTGFSGGIDSYSVIADHFYSNSVSESFKITHLLYNNIGSHGKGENPTKLFLDRYERLLPFAQKMSLPFVMVHSNLDFFYDGFSFEETHTPRNVSVALLFKDCARFLYASAYSYLQASVREKDSAGHSDSITLSLLSTESTVCQSVGSSMTRVEKTIKVATVPLSYQSLDVCVEDQKKGNCSKCWKCLRTLLTLELIGSINLYRDVFDLDVYNQNKGWYIRKILRDKHDVFSQEILSFANSKSFNFPFSYKVRSRLRYALELADKYFN